MKIYLAGDTHGNLDIDKFSQFKKQLKKDNIQSTKNDYMIVLGDFGVLWAQKSDQRENSLKKYYGNLPWTTLFIDGNHDNHTRINNLEQVSMFGSIVGKLTNSIFHLKRGEIYTIGDKTFLTFGGATSIDKHMRTENISWWKDECCSYQDTERALQNLSKVDNKVDYILAHTMPKSLMLIMFRYGYEKCPNMEALEHICHEVKFKHFFCGHWHDDKHCGRYHTLYDTILDIDDYQEEEFNR